MKKLLGVLLVVAAVLLLLNFLGFNIRPDSLFRGILQKLAASTTEPIQRQDLAYQGVVVEPTIDPNVVDPLQIEGARAQIQSIVANKVNSLQYLVAFERTYVLTHTVVEDGNFLGIRVPKELANTQNLYVFTGKVSAGIDLKKVSTKIEVVEAGNVDGRSVVKGFVVTVSLPPPSLYGVQILDRETTLLTSPILGDGSNSVRDQVENQIRYQLANVACSQGILNSVNTSAELQTTIQSLFGDWDGAKLGAVREIRIEISNPSGCFLVD